MFSRGRVLRTLSELSYGLVVLTTICAIGLSCIALLSQAVRTSPNKTWTRNFNALTIGSSYAIVLVASLVLCVNRRIAVRLKLHRISNTHRAIGRGDVPKPVYEYIAQEYMRACLVAYESQPKNVHHEGWGRPGTPYFGIRFRRRLLNTVADIDKLAHLIIPTHPPLRPHARMLHQFRFILPLLPIGEDGLSLLHEYDSIIQLARNSSREPTEEEFEIGMTTAAEICRILHECHLEMLEGSSTQLNDTTSSES